MGAAEIFELIARGLTLLPTLVDAGVNITQRIEQLRTLAKGGATGGLSADDIAKIRADFDRDLTEFNAPIE